MSKYLLPILFCGLIILSCSKEETIPEAQIPELSIAERSRLSADSLLMELYMAERGLDANFLDVSGVFVLVENLGEGIKHPNLNNTITLQYVLTNLDDELLESDENAVFQLKNEILGWQVGLPYFREGGRGILFIPSYLSGRDEVVICNLEILAFE